MAQSERNLRNPVKAAASTGTNIVGTAAIGPPNTANGDQAMRNLLTAIVVATVMASPVYAKTTTRDSATPTAPLSNGREVAAPPCLQQGPFTFNGRTSQFPHVTYGGK